MKKSLYGFYRKWGELLPIYDKTFIPNEYCSENLKNSTLLGKLLLKFFWCEYEPIKVDFIIKYNGELPSTKLNNVLIYQCKFGIIPKIFVRRI